MTTAVYRAADGSLDERWREVAHRWRSHAEHARVPAVKQEETVQLGRGDAVWLSVWACGLDAVLTLMHCDTSHCTNVALYSDWVAIVAPTELKDTVRVNGWEADCTALYLAASPNGYSAAGGGRAGLVLGLRRTRLAEACAALAGIDREDVEIRDLVVSLGRKGAEGLHAMLWAAIADSLQRPICAGRHALSHFWEEAVFARLAEILAPLLQTRQPGGIPCVNALHIVRAAEQACTDLARPPTMPELCAAAGVGERWLRKCFIEVRGAPPAQYLLKRRLSAAHDRFLDPVAETPSVKDVALSLGFVESGRFSQYYTSLFGENPRDTLLRSQEG